MKPIRTLTGRHLVHATALAFALTGGSAMAQAWPAKPISLVVPFPPGGTTDVLARALGEKLAKSLGQPIVIENRPGAGATLGADYVAKSKADGYTLLMGAVHHTIATSVYKKLPYDFQKDFAPVSTVAMVPNVLVVNASTPARDVAELVALAKAQPGKSTYGSNGNGTAQHLIGTQFQNLTGTELIHIPYKGSGPLAPAATPKELVTRLNAEIVKVIQSPDFRKRMDDIGAAPVGNSPDQMASQIREETEKFARLVKEARVTID